MQYAVFLEGPQTQELSRATHTLAMQLMSRDYHITIDCLRGQHLT